MTLTSNSSGSTVEMIMRHENIPVLEWPKHSALADMNKITSHMAGDIHDHDRVQFEWVFAKFDTVGIG